MIAFCACVGFISALAIGEKLDRIRVAVNNFPNVRIGFFESLHFCVDLFCSWQDCETSPQLSCRDCFVDSLVRSSVHFIKPPIGSGSQPVWGNLVGKTKTRLGFPESGSQYSSFVLKSGIRESNPYNTPRKRKKEERTRQEIKQEPRRFDEKGIGNPGRKAQQRDPARGHCPFLLLPICSSNLTWPLIYSFTYLRSRTIFS